MDKPFEWGLSVESLSGKPCAQGLLDVSDLPKLLHLLFKSPALSLCSTENVVSAHGRSGESTPPNPPHWMHRIKQWVQKVFPRSHVAKRAPFWKVTLLDGRNMPCHSGIVSSADLVLVIEWLLKHPELFLAFNEKVKEIPEERGYTDCLFKAFQRHLLMPGHRFPDYRKHSWILQVLDETGKHICAQCTIDNFLLKESLFLMMDQSGPLASFILFHKKVSYFPPGYERCFNRAVQEFFSLEWDESERPRRFRLVSTKPKNKE